MARGNTDTDQQAAAQLAALSRYFVEHPVTSRTSGARPTRTVAGAPLNLAVVDHIQASVHEVADHVRAHTPDAGPLPAEAAAVYEWAREHTEHADETVKRRHDVMVYRQHLEHAIRLGDDRIVRKHPCPGCGCYGLHWHAPTSKAVCRNRRCRTPQGRAQVWNLSFLAHEYIESQEKRATCAT